MTELIFEKCPLCDMYVAGAITTTESGRWGYGFKFRFDLGDFVCDDCDTELGPDEPRIKCLILGGCNRHQAMEKLGYVQIAAARSEAQ